MHPHKRSSEEPLADLPRKTKNCLNAPSDQFLKSSVVFALKSVKY